MSADDLHKHLAPKPSNSEELECNKVAAPGVKQVSKE